MRFNLGDKPVVHVVWRDPVTRALVDPTTTTVTLTKPDGTPGGGTAVVRASLGTFDATASAAVDQAGAWRYVAVATGAFEDRQDGAFVVTADNADLPWAPQLADVGAKVPMRTIEVGSVTGTPTGTFTSLTLPDDVQTDLLIDGAVAFVASAVGTLDATLWGLATEAAALRAAAAVELAQPAEAFDSRRYDQLVAAADAALTRLAARNAAVTGTSPDPGAALLPQWAFPTPVAWGDSDL